MGGRREEGAAEEEGAERGILRQKARDGSQILRGRFLQKSFSKEKLFLLRTVPGNQEPSPGLYFYYQTMNLSVTDFVSAVTFTAAFAEAAYPCSPSVGKIREANVFSPSLMKSSTELASM